MPKPKKNESKQDFLSRCTRELVEQEGREQDQAYAMCNAFWDDDKKQRRALTLSAPLELEKKEDDGAVKSFLITAYTGQPIESWFGKLVFDVAGMRAKDKIPILREHARDRVVGFSRKAWADDSRFYLRGDFSESTQDAQEVRRLAEEGFPWQASVGIWPLKVKVLKNEKVSEVVNGQEVKGPAEIWQESLVGETSFVALGADDNTAAIVLRREQPGVTVELDGCWEYSYTGGSTSKQEEEEIMDLEKLKKDHPKLYAEVWKAGEESGKDVGRHEGYAAGTDEERKRVVEILNADADPAVTRKAIEDGVAAEAAFKLFYEAEKKNRVDALKALETAATASVGQEQEKVSARADTRPADQQLNDIALDIAAEEKVPYVDALKLARQRNPELVKAWESQAVERAARH